MTRRRTNVGLLPKGRGTIFEPMTAPTLEVLRFHLAGSPLAVLLAAAMDVLPEPLGHPSAFPFGDGFEHGWRLPQYRSPGPSWRFALGFPGVEGQPGYPFFDSGGVLSAPLAHRSSPAFL